MRKKLLWLSFSVWIMLFTASGCQKDEKTQAWGNRVVLSNTGSKESGPVLVFYAGHDGKNCSGCVMLGGKLYHFDCQGIGTKCAVSTSVSIVQSGAAVTATTTDTFGLTSEDIFLMPARSLNYTDANNNRIFLNIPAQLLYRDTTTQQFTFTGLFFSDRAAYSND